MPRKKNTVGGGNQTNINGLGFEQETSLADALINAGFLLTPNNLIYIGKENISDVRLLKIFYGGNDEFIFYPHSGRTQ